MASSDGGFSAPSTAPTFAAGSAASGNSDVGAVFALPAPQQNGAPDTPGAANSGGIDENPFDAPKTAEATGPGGDATAGATGFEEVVVQEGGKDPKSPRAAQQSAASPVPTSQVSTRYRKIPPRALLEDLEVRGRRRSPRSPGPVSAISGELPVHPTARSNTGRGEEDMMIFAFMNGAPPWQK